MKKYGGTLSMPEVISISVFAFVAIVLIVNSSVKNKKEKFINSNSFDSSKILVDSTFENDKKIYIFSEDVNGFLLLETNEFIPAVSMDYTNCNSLHSYLLPEERHASYSKEELEMIEKELEDNRLPLIRKMR